MLDTISFRPLIAERERAKLMQRYINRNTLSVADLSVQLRDYIVIPVLAFLPAAFLIPVKEI